MREIKFRAWDTESNRMVYDPYFFDVYHFSDENRVNQKTYRYYEDWRALEDGRGWGCELMQYTGLKDKNGKEIYEGDIIEYEGWHGGIEHAAMERDLKNKGLPPPNYNERRAILGHPYGHYIMRKLNDTTDMAYSGDSFTHSQDVSGLYWEVIGNIYEHKHLLK